MYERLELLFPSRLIRSLRDLRGETWQALVDRVHAQPATSIEHLGFVLMMSRLTRCNTCTIDSQRAIRGCHFCARRAVERFKGSDADLLALYAEACTEVQDFLRERTQGEGATTSPPGRDAAFHGQGLSPRQDTLPSPGGIRHPAVE